MILPIIMSIIYLEGMKKNRRTIIFIPGFKGSTLLNSEGTLIWPNFIKAQFNRTISLSNDLPNIHIENAIHYESADIVESVTILPGLYKYPIYAKFIKALKKTVSPNMRLVVFHYDWRQDLMLTIAKLQTLIEKIAQDDGGQIDIISHSMGGLIASYVLQTIEVDVIRQVFLIAVPFQGSLKILLDLIYGSKFGLNKTLLSAKAMSSFPSLYYLLPRYSDVVSEHDIFDIETWKKFKLGYLTQLGDEAQLKFLKSQLDNASHFYNKLELAENKICEKTKLIFINSQVYPTPIQIELKPKINIISGMGDGSISNLSLLVPEYFKRFNHEIYPINKPHALSFTSDELIKIILKNLESRV